MNNPNSQKWVTRFTLRLDKEDTKIWRNFQKEYKLDSLPETVRYVGRNFRNYKEDSEAKLRDKGRELEETKAYVQLLEEKVPKDLQSENLDEKEIVTKALGLPSPYVECYDGFPVEGHPTWRDCRRDPSDRRVYIPKDRKTGLYIVKDPRVCGRCKALGFKCDKRKAKPIPKPKLEKPAREPYVNPQRNFNMGDNEGLPVGY